MRVLIANAPRSYREAFAGVLRTLRPRIEVVDVETEELEVETSILQPDLVICEHIPSSVKAAVPYWIEMRVENEVLVINSDTCRLPTTTNPGLYELISVIDQVEAQIQRGNVGHRNTDSTK